jgi:light-regulated signal transduction histidine kinase (bacteriophytochrome)
MTQDLSVKILIVDDKKENLLSLQIILSDLGYEFVEAASGKEALRILLKSQDFAIILMDVQMPLMDGFETAELIRQSEKLKHVPIIFLTANMNSKEYIFKGYQAGAVDYMIKPLSAEILKAKVMVFADLYAKNHELQIKEKETQALNNAILRANEELSVQNAKIEKHVNDLSIANRELEAFTYISSHDLQEPLRKIQTFASFLLDTEIENLSENGKLKFERIIDSADRMRRLIESLLEFSRTNVSKRKFEQINLNELVEDIRNELADIIEEKKVTFEVPELGSIHIIPIQFAQLIQNLLTNALKFSKPEVNPHIIITTRFADGASLNNEKLMPEKQYCQITFRDNGIGFEPAMSEKIFQVFQKLHPRAVYEGTGIGLAIVKKIVDNHNGLITATGVPMEGAQFDIYIPDIISQQL